MDIKDIKTIIELMKRNDLTHFELEREGEKLVLKKNPDPETLSTLLGSLRPPASAPIHPQGYMPVPPPAAPEPEAPAPTPAPAAPVPECTIKSPMVGTFYRQAGPGQEPFVKIGDYVEADTTVCIIEAMKVMNEIKAECSGKIVRICVEDATPVAYGQVLFEVKP